MLLLGIITVILVDEPAPAPRRDAPPATNSAAEPDRVASDIPTLPEPEPTDLGDGATTPHLALRVLSSSGRPLTRVRVTDTATGTPLGEWSDARDLVIPHGEDSGALVIEAPAHVSHVVQEQRIRDHVARDEVLICTLTAVTRVGGTLAWQDGRAGPPGVTVLAWPDSTTPTREEVVAATGSTGDAREPEMAREGDPLEERELLVATTDADGRFDFTVPVGEGRYIITAGGRGVVADRRLAATPSVRTEYRIGIQSVYALGIQLITPGGEYLPGLRTVRSAATRFGFHAQGVAGVSLRSPQTIERCLLDPLLVDPEAHGLQTVMLMATSPYQQVGPLRVVAQHPGREKLVTDHFIPSVADGLQVITLTLEASDLRTGSLEIRVVGWNDVVSALNPESQVLGLRLHPLHDDGPGTPDSATFDGTWFDGDSLSVHGIHHGEYSVDLDFGPLTARLSRTVVISDEPAEVSFDLAGLDAGSIRMEVEDRLGRPFQGGAEFDLLRPDGHHVSGHLFMSAPYLLPVVGPGRYRLHMISAHAADGDYPAARSAVFDVERGVRTTVRLKFDRME